MASLTDVRDRLDNLRYQGDQIYREATSGGSLDFASVRCIPGTTDEKQAKWSALQLEMTEVGAEYDRLRRIDQEMKAAAQAWQDSQQPANAPPFAYTNGNGNGHATLPHQPSLRQILDNNRELKTFQERKQGTASIEIPEAVYKATLTLADISPQADRGALVNMRMEERITTDLFTQAAASAAVVEWYEETTFTNQAQETAENTAKQESALDYTLRNSPIRVIATFIPVTMQVIADNAGLEAEVRSRLMFMVRRREETQVLVGNGTGENIRGVLATTGIQTTATGANIPTGILTAMQLVRGSAGAGFAEPDAVVMHPANVTTLMTTQTTIGDFIFQSILQNSPEMRIWGLPIRQTTAMTANTALVGDFNFGATLYRIGGLTVKASTEHADFFINNKVALLAESRIGLAVKVPSAFCTVTGLT